MTLQDFTVGNGLHNLHYIENYMIIPNKLWHALGAVVYSFAKRKDYSNEHTLQGHHILYISTDNGVDLSITHKILELIRGNRS